MTRDTRSDDAFVDALFADAVQAPAPPLPDALSQRVLADARAQQPPRVSLWTRMRAALSGFGAELGGAPGAAGLVSAGLMGVWLGFAPPAVANGVVAGVLDVVPGLEEAEDFSELQALDAGSDWAVLIAAEQE